MVTITEETLAQDYTEYYVQGIGVGEAEALAFGRLVMHQDVFPLVFESAEAAAQAKREIRDKVDGEIDNRMAAELWSIDYTTNEEFQALEAGAKAGYQHRIEVKEGEK